VHLPFLIEHCRDKACKGLRPHVALLTQIIQLVPELQSLIPALQIDPSLIILLSFQVWRLMISFTCNLLTAPQKTDKPDYNNIMTYIVCTSVARPDRPT